MIGNLVDICVLAALAFIYLMIDNAVLSGFVPRFLTYILMLTLLAAVYVFAFPRIRAYLERADRDRTLWSLMRGGTTARRPGRTGDDFE